MRIVYTPAALRQWLRLPGNVRRQIDEKLTRFAETGAGDLKKLQGRGGSRLRVGDWRVIFYTEGGNIVVAAVGNRRDVYK